MFYFFIPGISIFFGYASGYFCFRLNAKYAYTFFISFFIFILLIPLYEFYFFPSVYVFNPLFGFIRGTLFDEYVPFDWLFISYRIMVFLSAFILLHASTKIHENNRGKIVLLILFVTAIYIVFKPDLGYATDKNRLENGLGGKVVTDHFEILYPGELSEKKVKQLTLYHEYYYEVIKEKIGYEPSGKIVSSLFKDRHQKLKLFGSANTDMAKLWNYQVFTLLGHENITLKHEIVHAFSKEIGIAPLYGPAYYNPALLEGYAVCIENRFADFNPHYYAALAHSTGYKVRIVDLFQGFNFYGNLSSLAYIYSGSFLKYLMEKYGITKLNDLYSNLEFERIYGKALAELSEEYYSFLQSLNYEFTEAEGRLFFGRNPIFKKICPRIAASQLNKADKFYSYENYSESAEIYKKTYDYSGSYKSLAGYVYALWKNGDTVNVSGILENEIEKFSKSGDYYNLLMILGNFYSLENKPFSADSVFRLLKSEMPNINFYRIAETKIQLNKKNLLKEYLKSGSDESFNVVLKLNRDSLFVSSIVSLLNHFNGEVLHYNQLIELLDGKFEVKDFISSYSAYKISQFSIENFDYLTAKKFAELSLNYTHNESYKEVLLQNLDMINWFIKFENQNFIN